MLLKSKSDVQVQVAGPSSTYERKYIGAGSLEDPYIVDWTTEDVENPYNWSNRKKWVITAQLAFSTWTVSFCSSAYSGGLATLEQDLHISQEVAILGVSLYVLGFGLGPLVFAPMSEMFGRRPVFLVTYSVFTLFHLGGGLGQNATTLLVTRFFAGTFGSSPLTNAGATISDIWVARERGVAASLYATAPFLGPVIGPIVGGWISETRLGWRFSFWIMMMCSALALVLGFLLTPETYSPTLLRRRAQRLTKESRGHVHHISKYDIGHSKSLIDVLSINLRRPFVFLFTEPIVTLISIYIAIAYATLYAFFAAFPIVFQEHRHFSPGQGGLTFLGVGVGTLIGTCLAPVQNRLYWRAMDRSETGRAPPEARLYIPILGSLLLPIGLFWFAWTTEPSVPWIVPVLAGIPFGTGVATIMQGLIQYLLDAYSIYCASAIAATVVLRSAAATVFPLISPAMFARLGDQWACSVFAFLALACMPLPLMFFKYGPWLRNKSHFALKDVPRTEISPSATLADNHDVKGVRGSDAV